MTKNNDKKSNILRILFGIYIIIMFYHMFINRGFKLGRPTYWDCIRTSVNLIPFKSIVAFINIGKEVNWITAVMFFLSGFIYLPFGLLLPLLYPKLLQYKFLLLYWFLTIFGIKLIHLFTTMGVFDIDSFIVGFIGVSIGYLLAVAISRSGVRKKQLQID
jgi:glycopeptide antibiotics resistance protein